MSAKEFFNTMLKKTNEHSPEILTIGGSLLCIGAGIFASYQTYKKLPEIMKDHKNRRAEMEDTKKFATNSLSVLRQTSSSPIIKVKTLTLLLILIAINAHLLLP